MKFPEVPPFLSWLVYGEARNEHKHMVATEVVKQIGRRASSPSYRFSRISQ